MHAADESELKRIVFLDRDGCLNVDDGYVVSPEQVRLIPGAAEACAELRGLGYKLVVISNQSAIARGMASRKDVEATNSRLQVLLKEAHPDALLDMVLFSPDAPGQNSQTRKPNIGLLKEVSTRWQFDPANCWMLGDKRSDVQFGLNAGIPISQTLILRTGHGEEEIAALGSRLSPPIFASIKEAAAHIVHRDRN